MPGIEMERAFSALASPVRLPSPLGWAGMMGAFGAPRFAGVVAMPRDADPEMSDRINGILKEAIGFGKNAARRLRGCRLSKSCYGLPAHRRPGPSNRDRPAP